MKPSILKALRKATEISINFNPTQIALVPHTPIRKPGGGFDTADGVTRPLQTFLVEPVTSTLAGITGAGGGVVKTEGAKGHSWSYQITGKYDSQMEIGDTWKDGETVYTIKALQPFNNYERVGVVSAVGGDPSYGV